MVLSRVMLRMIFKGAAIASQFGNPLVTSIETKFILTARNARKAQGTRGLLRNFFFNKTTTFIGVRNNPASCILHHFSSPFCPPFIPTKIK
jgi:hypothetical protein